MRGVSPPPNRLYKGHLSNKFGVLLHNQSVRMKQRPLTGSERIHRIFTARRFR